MVKTIAFLIFLLSAGHAAAQGCPEQYRFVDFGLEGRDMVIRRGGRSFVLLMQAGQICRCPRKQRV